MPYSPDHKKGTRQRILKAAAHLFNEKGFSEASIEGIMTAAGLRTAEMYAQEILAGTFVPTAA